MSLRQLKFKPKLQPGGTKCKKDDKVTSTDDVLSNIPPDSSQIQKIPVELPKVSVDNVLKEIDVLNTTTSSNEIYIKYNGSTSSSRDKSSKTMSQDFKDEADPHFKEDETHFNSPEMKCDEGEKITGNLLPSSTGTTTLPSLRILRHKPKLDSLHPRSTNRSAKSSEVALNEERTSLSSFALQSASSSQISTPSPSTLFSAPVSNHEGPAHSSLSVPALLSKQEDEINSYDSSKNDYFETFSLTPKNKLKNERSKEMISCSQTVDKTSAYIEHRLGIHLLPIKHLNSKTKTSPSERKSRFTRNANFINNKSVKYDIYCNDVSNPDTNYYAIDPVSANERGLISRSPIKVSANESNFNVKKITSDPTTFSMGMKKSHGNLINKKKSLASIITTLTENCTKEMSNRENFSEPEVTQDLDESMKVIDEFGSSSKDFRGRKRLHKSMAIHGTKSIRSCHLGVPIKPKLTNRSHKPFASSTFGKMCFEAKQNFDIKFKNEKPDSSKLTMLDLIFYNPESNPMPEEKRPALDQSTERSTDSNSETTSSKERMTEKTDLDECDNILPVPQLKLSSDGKVIIAEESLHIGQTLGTISDDIQYESSGRYRKNSKKEYRTAWSHAETVQFYKALNVLGSDFETMKTFFPDRSRANLKRKFKREERIRGRLIDKVMSQPSEFDLKAALNELEFGHTFDETLATLGKNLQHKRDHKKDHPLFLGPGRKGFKEALSSKEYKKIMRECETSPKKGRKDGEFKRKESSIENINNIVISTNIEYEKVKYTQYTTYNSNNLDNPIEVNATISHESEPDHSLDESLNQCLNVSE